MVVRLEKQPAAPVRDRQRMDAVHRVQTRYHRLLDALPPADDPSEDVIEIAWMIEELRVNLFAQTLGTARPVSEERILTAIESATP
jgi:ATP-dependent helicase HrpA